MADWFAEVGLGGQETLDLFTAIGTGFAAQRISSDPDGDRWSRLVDDAVEMFFNHVQNRTSKTKTKKTKTDTSKGHRMEGETRLGATPWPPPPSPHKATLRRQILTSLNWSQRTD